MSNGALRFARYAYPPNALGYCGPADAQALREYADAGVSDGGLAQLARRFAGAWPYLALIGAANAHADPLDDAVVEAYWLGNPLLERVPPGWLVSHLDERFGADAVTPLALQGGRAHHNFHVFAVYPWVGMLRAGFSLEPLRVLDSCRVAWGEVMALPGDGLAAVWSQPLVWDGHRLSLGPYVMRTVSATGAAVGDTVSLHWDWVCEVLTPVQARRLRHYTTSQLRVVNELAAKPCRFP